MTNAPPKSVLDTILDWSSSRPDWQRDALRRIVATGKISAEDTAELVQLCLKGQGAEEIEVEAQPLVAAHLPSAVAAGAAISLASIAQVSGVNRLAAGQTLPFASSGITVVYGDNGVGKSGYARILKRACRARFVGEILADAFDPMSGGVPTAQIAYNVGATAADPISWANDDKPHPVLSAISVFDRESGAIHVRNENQVAFRPFGLDVPDELAGACVAVKEVLTETQTRLKGAQDMAFQQPAFSVRSPVGSILANLKATTKLDRLSELAVVSADEDTRLARLNEDLARDPILAAAENIAFARGLQRLHDDLTATLAKTSVSLGVE